MMVLVLGLLKCIIHCILVITVSFYICDENYLNEPSLHGPHAYKTCPLLDDVTLDAL